MSKEHGDLSPSQTNQPQDSSPTFAEDDGEKSHSSDVATNKNSSLSIPERGEKLSPHPDNAKIKDNQLISLSSQPTSFSKTLDPNSIERAKQKAKIREIERTQLKDAINDWIGFAATKIVGTGALVVGGLEIIAPSLLTVTIAAPFTPVTLVGIGLALLAGEKSIFLVKNVLYILAKGSEDPDS